MKYDINQIIESSFNFEDLKSYPTLRISILNLKIPTLKKIKITEILLKEAKLPEHINHHIKIRLELLEEIISLPPEIYYP